MLSFINLTTFFTVTSLSATLFLKFHSLMIHNIIEMHSESNALTACVLAIWVGLRHEKASTSTPLLNRFFHSSQRFTNSSWKYFITVFVFAINCALKPTPNSKLTKESAQNTSDQPDKMAKNKDTGV